MCPKTGEPGEQVFELSQLDLSARFSSTSSLNKDLQNETTPIEHLYFENLFKILDLAGGQIVIEDHQIRS